MGRGQIPKSSSTGRQGTLFSKASASGVAAGSSGRSSDGLLGKGPKADERRWVLQEISIRFLSLLFDAKLWAGVRLRRAKQNTQCSQQ